MVELIYEEQRSSRSRFGDRDGSPDSVIFTLESSLSLFSSTSASVDRCSFASDALDHDSASEVSLHFARHERECSSGPDPDPNPNKATLPKHSRLPRKAEKAKVQKGDSECDTKDGKQVLNSARSSFSLALKECEDGRSDALSRRLDRRRPASLDFSNGTELSPRIGCVKKSPMALRKSSAFPSPGTPNYWNAGGGLLKGWSSERVPLQSSAGRRNLGMAFLPFNNNGRTLPSKWEDAERWILSPVSSDAIARRSLPPPQRRPKSKSGPLGPSGVAYYSLYSPVLPVHEGGRSFLVGSPFSAGVIRAEGYALQNSRHHGGTFPIRSENRMGRSVSVHGCSELLNEQAASLPEELADKKLEGVKDAGSDISRDVSRRDIATQMSRDGSDCSSPKRGFSFSKPHPDPSIVDLQRNYGTKLGVKDVQVDEQVTFTGRSKKSKNRILVKGSGGSEVWTKKDINMDVPSSDWDISDTTKDISKLKREEAKVTAWENLQKAKAEAAIRKLEMKLEKKRSSSMDKIMKKLRSAQKRAQEMRSSVLANQSHQIAGTSHKTVISRRTRQMGSLSGCFACHAF
ncbi:hypothetical protein SAY86_010616 [Trapa natans]|uniref:Remorin C-terminal domain-containing protein n=1 Tax=Trapa natans TaxID=22666 RepID=A0AAN7R5N0_TRANT|nr:hypothetical protein SAY86_010616 [Trapa natans]